MRTRAVALAAATATALSGCSMLSSDGDSSGSSESSESGQASEGESGEATTQTALAAGIDPEDPPKAIAEGTFKSSSDDVSSTKIELLKLQPKDNVMLAVFRFTGDGRGNAETSVYDLMGKRSFDPVLIDLKNLEKYTTVDDLSPSPVYTKAPLGDPMYYFTAFPLPRDGVEAMDLRMAEQMGAIEDVPMPQS
ncbi:hypothetical protein [Janibacter cremeus]|uniref:Lipoprotein n=1 Tax=Janibacter cremeus TaxID=1285192 RepID=A0A852VQ01_9MICO|nr:hypothetical protein [Janibacter cremeus]NYF98266.1 hypothetical protein [Janibacter cremeus]